MHTLILNSDAQPLSMLPLSTLSWKDALRLTFLNKVNILEYYDNWKVHSVSESFRVPSVVIVRQYVQRRTIVALTKPNLYLRDGYKCQYCGNSFDYRSLTYDHVWPRSKGGLTEWENIVAACKSCNTKKGASIIEPLNQPFMPTYWNLIKRRAEVPIVIRHYSWKRFIDPKMNVRLIEYKH
jgi:5-methylcytosine-specific restriction endonuclease McrA